jgi:MFS family permease
MVSRSDIPLNQVKRIPQPKILFPNEHGAWAMFFTAFLLGWLAAPVLSWRPLFLLPAAIGAFLARYPIGLYFKKRRVTRAMKIPLTREKKWFWIYSLLTLALAIPLFYPLGWWWLLIFAALSTVALIVHLCLVTQRKERSLFSEIIAMIGLSFLMPATSYAALLLFHWQLPIVWGLFILYFIQRIIVVRQKVSQRDLTPVEIKKIGNRELLYSVIFVVIVAVGVRILNIA